MQLFGENWWIILFGGMIAKKGISTQNVYKVFGIEGPLSQVVRSWKSPNLNIIRPLGHEQQQLKNGDPAMVRSSFNRCPVGKCFEVEVSTRLCWGFLNLLCHMSSLQVKFHSCCLSQTCIFGDFTHTVILALWPNKPAAGQHVKYIEDL